MNIKPGLILPPHCAELVDNNILESFETQEEADAYFNKEEAPK